MKAYLPSFILLLLMTGLFACSYTSLDKAQDMSYATPPPSIIVVGYVRNAGEPFFKGFKDGLGELPGAEVVSIYSIEKPGHGAVKFTGTLDIRPRDSFAEKAGRHLVGFGLGRREIHGHFEIEDTSHTTLTTLTATEYYNGGTGLGGFLDVPGWLIGPFVEGFPGPYQTDLISTDTMQKRLGADVGRQVRHWLLAGQTQ